MILFYFQMTKIKLKILKKKKRKIVMLVLTKVNKTYSDSQVENLDNICSFI